MFDVVVVLVFQAAAMTNCTVELNSNTTNTHQRAQDLLAFINNITMAIDGGTSTLN